ncbi:hypothetical protein IFM89_023613 [Coptis chinensis]|uniref:Major facilitator superfamily (MFS) profile domain-containing protein n=1 Tax=Coptis chinensis TaxID=261450 RepID=A0A835HPJ6_9MAGN|nr:hypothetical protein IFM89_023613 [Coptis chinensis]
MRVVVVFAAALGDGGAAILGGVLLGVVWWCCDVGWWCVVPPSALPGSRWWCSLSRVLGGGVLCLGSRVIRVLGVLGGVPPPGLTLLGLLGLDCQSALLLPPFVAFQVILTIAVFRVFVGVGEASFVSLAAPFINDNAPVAQKTAWLAAFYMCIPGGIACGYVLGGLVASHFSWRWAFYGEAILIFSWAVLAFVIKPLSLKGFSDGKSIKGLTSGEVLPHEAEGYTKTQHCLGQLLWPFGLPAMLYQSSSDFAMLLSGCSDDEVGLLWCLAKPFVESKTL